ncbi:MAG: family hydrolase, partial [Paenibacillus sp.]|nr:family hydrolase [Paenibacillus sp.]
MPVKCLGCRLANGHESAEIIFEDEFITCLLDIAPLHDVHLLILTKKHYLDSEEMVGQTASAVMNASVMLSKTL